MKNRLLPCLLPVLGAATVAPAQSIVSPVFNATVEGSSNSTVPFATTGARRVLQIHGDLGSTPRLMKQIAFRMNASATNYTGTNAIDMELYVGHTVLPSSIRFFYDQNYVSPRQTAIARRIVNFGPQGQAVTPGPNPFTSNMILLFDAPVPFNGTGGFAWDALVFTSTTTGSFNSLDGEIASMTTGSSTITGTGCTCLGRTTAMTHVANSYDYAGVLALSFTVSAGPGNAAVILSVGHTNPNLTHPWLCSPLLTNMLLQIPIGTTSATGSTTTTQGGAGTLVLPNSIPGGIITTQVHAIDPGRTDPIPVCNSNGRQVTIPTSDMTRPINVGRVYNNSNTTTPPEAGFISTFTVGFGIITEWSY